MCEFQNNKMAASTFHAVGIQNLQRVLLSWSRGKRNRWRIVIHFDLIETVFVQKILIDFLLLRRKLRSKRPPRILMCLCVALMLTLIIFLAGISAKDLKGCQTVALLIHFFVLASFMWMAVEGFNLYLSFVKIVPSSIPYFIVKASLFAWGMCCSEYCCSILENICFFRQLF